MNRRPLRKQLIEAWQEAIESDYCSQRINSERSLQAAFWARLNNILPEETRRMFIEPVLKVPRSGRTHFPDIVICNTQEVIAVVEIKYQPRVLPSHKKDLRTLSVVAANREHLSVSNTRIHGVSADPKKYPFSKDVLFVLAGVHKSPKTSFGSKHVPLLATGISGLAGCFLQLHAETHADDQPKVFARSGKELHWRETQRKPHVIP